ncbi:MAG: DUF169 domain-containing protein [Acidobacteriota bacterium]
MTTTSALTRMQLARQPVAVAFLPVPPAGMERIDRPAAAGCGYWKYASDGHSFYTTAEDHQNCTVGAFTHGVTLPPAKAEELRSLMGTMMELQYLRSDEVAGIPHRQEPLQVAAYAPLDAATFAPDVVIFRGNARQIMLLSEAARAARAFDTGTAMGRPACAMVPQAAGSTAAVASIGCIGNRVYTELGDDELYLAVPGNALDDTLGQLDTILTANAELEKFHKQRAAALA